MITTSYLPIEMFYNSELFVSIAFIYNNTSLARHTYSLHSDCRVYEDDGLDLIISFNAYCVKGSRMLISYLLILVN